MVTVSYVLELLRDAICPALTGGCHYDSSQAEFSNLFHIYLWAFLAAFPIAIHLAIPSDSAWVAWVSYSIVVGVFFSLAKLAAIVLHWIFDTFAVQETTNNDEEAQHPFLNPDGSGDLNADDSTNVVTTFIRSPDIEEATEHSIYNHEPESLIVNTAPEIPDKSSLVVAEVHQPTPKFSAKDTVLSNHLVRRRPPYTIKQILANLPARNTLRRAQSLSDISVKSSQFSPSSTQLPRRRVVIAETRLDDVSFLKEPVGATSSEVPCHTTFFESSSPHFLVAPSLPPSMRLHHRNLYPHDTASSHLTLDEPFSDTELGGASLQLLPIFDLKSDENVKITCQLEGKLEQSNLRKNTTQSTPFLPAPTLATTSRPNQSTSSTAGLDRSRHLNDSLDALDFVKSESRIVEGRFSQTNLPLDVQREILHKDQPKEEEIMPSSNSAHTQVSSKHEDEDLISLKWLFDNEDQSVIPSKKNRHHRRPSLRSQLQDLRSLLEELRLADQDTDSDLHDLHRRLERLQAIRRDRRCHSRNASDSSSSTVNVSADDAECLSSPNSTATLNQPRNDTNHQVVTRGGRHRLSSFERVVTGLLTRQGTLQQPMRAPGLIEYSSVSGISVNLKKNRRIVCKIDKGKIQFDLKLQFDRLSLMAFMDVTRTIWEILFIGLIAGACAFLTGELLKQRLFVDLEFILLVFVLASAQFSLFKSVQPDPSSPVHGFNPITPYTRPAFFLLLTTFLLMAQVPLSYSIPHFQIWNFDFPPSPGFITAVEACLKVLLLTFPILFTLGVFAQLNTATLCLMEQVNIHIFGGSGLTTLAGGFLSIVRSICSVAVVFPFAYLAISDREGIRSVWLALFSAISIPMAFHLSRQPSDVLSLFSSIWATCQRCMRKNKKQETDEEDPIFEQVRATLIYRMKADLLTTIVAGALVFSLQVSTLLSNRGTRPHFFSALIYTEAFIGFILHYVLPEMRNNLPWRFIAFPILKSKWTPFAATLKPPSVTIYEKMAIWLTFFEKNVLLVCIVVGAINQTVQLSNLTERFGLIAGALLLSTFTLRALRQTFSQTSHQWVLILFTHLLFNYDLLGKVNSETLLFDLVVTSFCFYRLRELSQKLHFVLVYSAPWQVTWGSVCHALFHPLSLPHSALLIGQTVLASLISAPVQPFMGSVLFLMSYPRPLKFWERNYYTRRLDNSNTRLATQLQSVGDRGPSAPLADTQDNLNSVFYEQLANSLRQHLAGDILMGRWGEVYAGDCFILASDHLNALVHIIEVGNNVVIFQLRGLELRGTYCQQRELEAICEWPGSDRSFCCCNPGRLPSFLSFNATFQQRWLAWRVVTSNYVLPGYSVAETPAHTLLDSHDLKRLFLSHFVRSLIFFAFNSDRLDKWLESEAIQTSIATILSEPHSKYCDLDMSLAPPVSDDYDVLLGGVSLRRFSERYNGFIKECSSRLEAATERSSEGQENRQQLAQVCSNGSSSSSSSSAPIFHAPVESTKSKQSEHSVLSDASVPESHRRLVAFSFMLAIMGRRLLATAARGSLTTTEFLLRGIHAMLKGDLRLTSARDDWVLVDVEMLHTVVSPALRIAIKLLQEYFVTGGSDDNDPTSAYKQIEEMVNDSNSMISHEADPKWRNAILSGQYSMTALRQIQEDAAMDDFRLITLRYTHLGFRLVSLNSECVRGLWAGQQQELIFYRNRNPERGSIQNAKQVLRNMINSSCDQPLGYPIFVSPLLTSFASDHPMMKATMGPEIGFEHIVDLAKHVARRIRVRCGLALLNTSSPQCSAPQLNIPKPDVGIELTALQQQQQQGNTCSATSEEAASCV